MCDINTRHFFQILLQFLIIISHSSNNIFAKQLQWLLKNDFYFTGLGAEKDETRYLIKAIINFLKIKRRLEDWTGFQSE